MCQEEFVALKRCFLTAVSVTRGPVWRFQWYSSNYCHVSQVVQHDMYLLQFQGQEITISEESESESETTVCAFLWKALFSDEKRRLKISGQHGFRQVGRPQSLQ